jgi:hypothetical protein
LENTPSFLEFYDTVTCSNTSDSTIVITYRKPFGSLNFVPGYTEKLLFRKNNLISYELYFSRLIGGQINEPKEKFINTWSGDQLTETYYEKYQLTNEELELLEFATLFNKITEVQKSQLLKIYTQSKTFYHYDQSGKLIGDSTVYIGEAGITDTELKSLKPIIDKLKEYSYYDECLPFKNIYTSAPDYQLTLQIHSQHEFNCPITAMKDSLSIKNNSYAMRYGFASEKPDYQNMKLVWQDSLVYNKDGSLGESYFAEANDSKIAGYIQKIVYQYASSRTIKSTAIAEQQIFAYVLNIKGKTTLRLSITGSSDISIQLFSSLGKALGKKENYTVKKGITELPLTLKAKGKYFCKISTPSATQIVPFYIIN